MGLKVEVGDLVCYTSTYALSTENRIRYAVVHSIVESFDRQKVFGRWEKTVEEAYVSTGPVLYNWLDYKLTVLSHQKEEDILWD